MPRADGMIEIETRRSHTIKSIRGEKTGCLLSFWGCFSKDRKRVRPSIMSDLRDEFSCYRPMLIVGKIHRHWSLSRQAHVSFDDIATYAYEIEEIMFNVPACYSLNEHTHSLSLSIMMDSKWTFSSDQIKWLLCVSVSRVKTSDVLFPYVWPAFAELDVIWFCEDLSKREDVEASPLVEVKNTRG